jgi:hypothetical protein
MKSKLTLQIDAEVKDAAQRLAKERGESVSAMVEAYLRLLAQAEDHALERGTSASEGSGDVSRDWGPLTRRIAGALQDDPGAPIHGTTKDADRAAVAQAARRKHGES